MTLRYWKSDTLIRCRFVGVCGNGPERHALFYNGNGPFTAYRRHGHWATGENAKRIQLVRSER